MYSNFHSLNKIYHSSGGKLREMLPSTSGPYLRNPKKPTNVNRLTIIVIAVFKTLKRPRKFCGFFILFSRGITCFNWTYKCWILKYWVTLNKNEWWISELWWFFPLYIIHSRCVHWSPSKESLLLTAARSLAIIYYFLALSHFIIMLLEN